MDAQDFLSIVLTQLLARSPVLLAELIGALIVVLAWRRSPRACLMALLGCLGLFAVSVLSALGWPVLLHLQRANDWPAARMGLVTGTYNLALSVVQAALFLLLVVAVVTGRTAVQAPPRRPAGRDDGERTPRRAEPPADPTGIQQGHP